MELPPEREADVRRAGGEPGPDTVGDGQPGVRGLWAAAVGHAAHQPRVVRRRRSRQLRRVNAAAAAARPPTRVAGPTTAASAVFPGRNLPDDDDAVISYYYYSVIILVQNGYGRRIRSYTIFIRIERVILLLLLSMREIIL